MSIDMESDFRPTQGATAEDRIAEALEYIAYQLFRRLIGWPAIMVARLRG